MNTLNKNEYKISLTEVISKNLAFRKSVDELFTSLNKSNSLNVIVDFQDVESITRSFAHQFLLLKKKSKKTISEINIDPKIQKMFNLIKKQNRLDRNNKK